MYNIDAWSIFHSRISSMAGEIYEVGFDLKMLVNYIILFADTSFYMHI